MRKKVTLNKEYLGDYQNIETIPISVVVSGQDEFILNVYSNAPLETKAEAVNLMASGCFVDIDGAVKPSINGIEFLHSELNYSPVYRDAAFALGLFYAFTDLDITSFETLDDVDMFARCAKAKPLEEEDDEIGGIISVILRIIQRKEYGDIYECANDLVDDYRQKLNGSLLPTAEISMDVGALINEVTSIFKRVNSFIPADGKDMTNISDVFSKLAGMNSEDLIDAVVDKIVEESK